MNYCKLFVFLNRILISLSVFDCNAPMSPVEIWRNISAFIIIIIIFFFSTNPFSKLKI